MSLLRLSLGIVFAAALSATPAASQVRIAVVGDSNVAGTGVGDTARYPAQLEAALRASGLSVTVTNGGINGDTVGGVTNRIDSAAPPGTQVVVLWVGINDRRLGAERETIRAQLGALAARLRARGALVYVIRPDIGGPIRSQQGTTLGSDGQMWRGQPDPHFNRRGYALMVQRTLAPIRALVVQASRRRG
jgi:acyl-CoA thioesterase-1